MTVEGGFANYRDRKFSDFNLLCDGIIDSAEDMTNLSVDDKYKITQAQGKVLKKATRQAIISDGHVRNGKKTGSYKHLKDSVGLSKKNEDGLRVGVTRVGFDKKHARIARWLNDGFKSYHGDHFVENSFADVKSEMQEVGKKVYKELKDG